MLYSGIEWNQQICNKYRCDASYVASQSIVVPIRRTNAKMKNSCGNSMDLQDLIHVL